DGGAFRARSVWYAWKPDVSKRGPGALWSGRQYRVRGAVGRSGKDSRLSHRVGRDRMRLVGRGGGARSGGGGSRGGRWRPAAGGIRRGARRGGGGGCAAQGAFARDVARVHGSGLVCVVAGAAAQCQR